MFNWFSSACMERAVDECPLYEYTTISVPRPWLRAQLPAEAVQQWASQQRRDLSIAVWIDHHISSFEIHFLRRTNESHNYWDDGKKSKSGLLHLGPIIDLMTADDGDR